MASLLRISLLRIRLNAKTKDNLVYIGIALGIAAILLGPLIYAIIHGTDIPEFPLKRAWLTISTVVLVAYVIQDMTRRHRTLWTILSSAVCVALVHSVITAMILHALTRVPLLLLGFGIFVEAYIALQIIDRLVVRRVHHS